MNQQQKVILLASASAAIVVVGVLLYLHKKSQEDEEDEETKDTSDAELEFADLNAREVASAAQTVVEVKVPSYIVGGIIGKGGSQIKQLKAEFGVWFEFDRDEPKDDQFTENKDKKDRTLVIRGEREKVRAAEQKVKSLIENSPKFVEEEILVPQESCGRIIGKGGQSIREMCSISGAKITVDRNEDHSLGVLKRVFLVGTSMQVDYAKLLVEEKVEEEKAFRNKKKQQQTTGKERVSLKDIAFVSLPYDHNYHQVFVSSFDSPSHLWVQVVTEESAKLDEMTKKLTEHYGQMSAQVKRLEQGQIGDLCIAPFDDDADWYRASIRNFNRDGTANLYYIDFGDSRDIHVDQLKVIEEEYSALPVHAIECYINIKPSGNEWSKESHEEFESITRCAQWIPLMAKIVGYKDVFGQKYPLIDLVDTKDSKDVNIVQTLIANGHGLEPQEDETVNMTVKSKQVKIDEEIVQSESLTDVESSNYALPPTREFIQNNFLDENIKIVHKEPSVPPPREHEEEDQFDIVLSEKESNSSVCSVETGLKEQLSTIVKVDTTSASLIEAVNKDVDVTNLKDQPSFRQASVESDGFVDIDVSTVNGAITAVVNEHIPCSTNQQVIASSEQKPSDEGNADMVAIEKTIVEDNIEDGKDPTSNVSLEQVDSEEELESELQKSLDETSRKNVLVNSMELARKNLVTMSNEELSSFDDSFMSAKSELTITSTEGNSSFMTAHDRLTPTNDLSMSLPDFGEFDVDDVTPQPSPLRSSSQFGIQYIDEKTNKVISREALNTTFDASKKKKIGKETPV